MLDQCWLYDMATKKWVEMLPLITARYCHRSDSLGDSVYVVGGKGAGDKEVGMLGTWTLGGGGHGRDSAGGV